MTTKDKGEGIGGALLHDYDPEIEEPLRQKRTEPGGETNAVTAGSIRRPLRYGREHQRQVAAGSSS
jgi:hypothetical protein